MRAGYSRVQGDQTTILPPPLLPWLVVFVIAVGVLSEFIPR